MNNLHFKKVLEVFWSDLVQLLPAHVDKGNLPEEGHSSQDGDDEAEQDGFQPNIGDLFQLAEVPGLKNYSFSGGSRMAV